MSDNDLLDLVLSLEMRRVSNVWQMHSQMQT
jgi:hypothetical protein